jgi:hypothetical protein
MSVIGIFRQRFVETIQPARSYRSARLLRPRSLAATCRCSPTCSTISN